LYHCRFEILVYDLVKIRDTDIVKLTLYDDLYVHETDYTIFIHTQTLCWTCIFCAMSEYAHGQ